MGVFSKSLQQNGHLGTLPALAWCASRGVESPCGLRPWEQARSQIVSWLPAVDGCTRDSPTNRGKIGQATNHVLIKIRTGHLHDGPTPPLTVSFLIVTFLRVEY